LTLDHLSLSLSPTHTHTHRTCTRSSRFARLTRHTHRYDTWNDFNRSYGYDPIKVDQDHCPGIFYELGIKQAQKVDTILKTIHSEMFVSSEHKHDVNLILSDHNVVVDPNLANYIVRTGEMQETTRDMSQKLKYVKEYIGTEVRTWPDNSTFVGRIETSLLLETVEIWPPRICTVGGIQYPPGDSACDNVEDYTYDLSNEDGCFSPCYNPLDDTAVCQTLACSSQDPDPSKICRDYWAGTVPGCFCLDLQEQRLGSDNLGFFDYIEALYDLHTEYPICT